MNVFYVWSLGSCRKTNMKTFIGAILSVVLFLGFNLGVFGSNPATCSRELAEIEYQPFIPSLPYLRLLEAEVKTDSAAWFNTNTIRATAIDFANKYGIEVKVLDAMGRGYKYPSLAQYSSARYFSYFRSMSLNSDAYVVSNGLVYFSFPLRNARGEVLMIIFVQPVGKIF